MPTSDARTSTLRVLLLSRYGRLAASSRVRSYQYLPYLSELGIAVESRPLFDDESIQRLYRGQRRRAAPILGGYLRRLWHVLSAFRYDLLWIEYELFPWLPAWFERVLSRMGVPYVVDYDDAIFHRYDSHRHPFVRRLFGGKIDRVMRGARLVMAGSDYLSEHAQRAGARRVEWVPTVVDLNRYQVPTPAPDRPYTVGWIGQPLTTPYLQLVRDALAELGRENSMRVTLVGSGPVTWDQVAVDIRPWSESTEVAELQQFDVGIMPLPDAAWERGKCGYKLIQYMACGRPVVASPVGASRRIVDHGVNGFLAANTAEWVQALRALRDPALRTRMGIAGRAKVEQEYCVQVIVPRLASLLRESARPRSA
ncbi:MAG TPA: glycosyltransferase family 4 protein [Gemmatimonadales bacterium]|nr:glycosyltransferase family 4 protein [Gemmatimonadales bacterium]